MSWSHDALAEDLAGHLKSPDRMVWTDIQLGRAGSPRPDVYTIDKSFVRPRPTAYECKVSVSDFRSDATSGKWSSYLEYAHSVIFAAPVGLISKGDVPEQCGLIVRHENAWRYAKKPIVNPRPIAEEALIKLLIDGVHREGPRARAKHWENSYVTKKFAEKFGAQAARHVCDAASTHELIARADRDATRITERARKEAAEITAHATQHAPVLWADLLEVCGLRPDASKWDVEFEVRKLREAKDGSPETRAIRQVVANLRRTTETLERLIPAEVPA